MISHSNRFHTSVHRHHRTLLHPLLRPRVPSTTARPVSTPPTTARSSSSSRGPRLVSPGHRLPLPGAPTSLHQASPPRSTEHRRSRPTGPNTVDVSYATPQAHGIVNVALHWVYSLDIVVIYCQGRKDLYHV
jgi:hypothetical protein